MAWLTIGDLRRVMSASGILVSEKTIRTWARVPGASRLVANRRVFDHRVPQLLLAGHDLVDIAAALRNGASPHELERLPPGSSRRGNPLLKQRAERHADSGVAS